MDIYQINSKIVTDIGFWTNKTCSKFQLNQNTHLRVM